MSGVVIVADDDAAIRTVLRQALNRAGHKVLLTDSGEGLHALVARGQGDLVISDVVFPDANGLDLIPALLALRPGLKIIVISAQNSLTTAVRATEQGAFEYLPKPFDLNEVINAVKAGLEDIIPSESNELGSDESALVGRSPAMQEVYRLIARVVPNDLTVMILGESGTGKELVARAIHDMGPRRAKPFVAVNMAAIPRELIESELFGFERGAFTGAAARTAGKFEQAQGGTLFLDEIGDMPLEAQTRLLRVLQTGEFTILGGSRTQQADVRIVTATNQDLLALTEQGRFREDLFYRLNVVPLALPPLRERLEDVPVLARHFLAQAAFEGLPRKALDTHAIAVLRSHKWPGNVRELENLMRRLAVLERSETIGAAAVINGLGGAGRVATSAKPGNDSDDLRAAAKLHIDRYFAGFGDQLPPDGVYHRLLAEVEGPLVRACMAAAGGNQVKAARLLGINRNTLRQKLNGLEVETGVTTKA